MNEPTMLHPWEAVAFPWGAAVRHRKGDWTHVCIGELTIDLADVPHGVILHPNGIEFVMAPGGEAE